MVLAQNPYTEVEQTELDDAVLALRRLAYQNPVPLQAAGARVWSRVSEKIQAAHASKREGRNYELRLREAARQIALGHASNDDREGFVREFGSRVLEEAQVLRVYQRCRGDLQEREPIEACLDYYAYRVRSNDRKKGRPQRSLSDIRESLRGSYDVDEPNQAATPALFLAQDLLRLVYEKERVRPAADWWEIAALFLAIECPDITAQDLGIDTDLPWDVDEQDENNLLNRREDMKDWMEMMFGCGQRQLIERWQKYRVAATRCVRFLSVLAAQPPSDSYSDCALSSSRGASDTSSPSPNQHPSVDSLSPAHRDILHALYERGATSVDGRVIAANIARLAFGSSDGDWVKRQIKELRDRGFVDSRIGRGGGYWLTDQGVPPARAIAESRKGG